MALILVEPEEKGYELIPEDSYSAICYAIIDNGEAFNDHWQKKQRKVTLMWELEYENGNHEVKRGTISKTYTFSMHMKSTLRTVLKAWRGREFTPEELKGFALRNVLGAPCLLQVTHYTTTDGAKRADVTSVSKLPKAVPALAPEKEMIFFDCEESDLALLNIIPTYLVDRIRLSDTYKRRMQADSTGVVSEHIEDCDDGDLPF